LAARRRPGDQWRIKEIVSNRKNSQHYVWTRRFILTFPNPKLPPRTDSSDLTNSRNILQCRT
jgi:hypothetical protein